ncbi:hypothetical protein BU24DRAFT_462338 [Aaosphaeria arxii CBS 175.79]|uniref:PWWP domain-containing protein n=1 Tax=Aaosphaeria arxii CBS 175.79 TaxID=1450172 RepID=A0A6A5XTK3_9PLEO|nr:uncharacterized protein BU24DRAFT_462338 [Aaosphaeria arxii CBS 175.79]KAF2016147.1 hypothetical protein BU24DRAFT_462338 [Aaosphaeria arxii CBS 175.79]
MSTLSYRRGTYVIHQPYKPGRPGWPAVVIGYQDIPSTIRNYRSEMLEVPILLLHKNDIRWVNDDELSPFRSQTWTDEDACKYPGLREAFLTMINGVADGLEMVFWRILIENRYDEELPPDTDTAHADHRTDQRLIEAPPVQDLKGKGRTVIGDSATPSSIWTMSVRDGGKDLVPLKRSYDRSFSSDNCLYPSSTSRGESSKRRGGFPSGNEKDDINASHSLQLRTGTADSASTSYNEVRAGYTVRSEQFNEMDDDPEFVKFPVGPNRKPFYIPLHVVRDNGFCSAIQGDSIVRKNGKGWIYDRPSLCRVQPDEFEFVADFMYNKEFGLRQIGSEEEKARCFAECAGAWTAGEEIGIEELLDHIVAKLPQTAPWSDVGLEIVLFFAARVWETSGEPSRAHRDMKAMLSTFIADHFFEYVCAHFGDFKKQLDETPELAADIYTIMGDRARAKVGLQEE